MTDNLFRPSKEMREYDALRVNAEKAELIRAAETLKKYCDKVYPDITCPECVCYLPICSKFRYEDELRDVMEWFIERLENE